MAYALQEFKALRENRHVHSDKVGWWDSGEMLQGIGD